LDELTALAAAILQGDQARSASLDRDHVAGVIKMSDDLPTASWRASRTGSDRIRGTGAIECPRPKYRTRVFPLLV
jgi:hypothetical protein